ncbi:MAG: ARMT1-like domain-containing protein, partial [Thermodesulfovibrionales bacterium]
KTALGDTAEVLYLLDNAGEIVFDRILIEAIQSFGKKVTAVVKGSAIINDCTYEDALETALTEVCEVIDNGSDAVGTIVEWTSPEFQRIYRQSPFLISKGQGNFETVSEPEKAIFYLFQSKCEVVSKELGLSLGSMILSKSRFAAKRKD